MSERTAHTLNCSRMLELNGKKWLHLIFLSNKTDLIAELVRRPHPVNPADSEILIAIYSC